jgi:P27 family predicted phage terminase small subunit
MAPKTKTLAEPHSKPNPQNPGAVVPEPACVVECPPELGPVAREEWHRIVGELSALGILTRFDRAALAVYCSSFAMWLQATQMIQDFGTVIKSPNDYPVQSPYVSIANHQAELMLRIACEFGFTPASRDRVRAFRRSNSNLLENGDGLEPW